MTIAQFLKLAREHGLKVYERNGLTIVEERGPDAISFAIWPDRQVTRADVDLSLMIRISKIEAARALGLVS